MFVSNRDILRKTAKKYLSQARQLLHFFGYEPKKLQRGEETMQVFRRRLTPKLMLEYCALEWDTVQRICSASRKEAEPYIDSIVGRAVLTIAYTTGERVGCLLPSSNKHRMAKHSPITRDNIRRVSRQYHIWQPKSKTDREGRGRLIIVSPTGCTACPTRALRELLICPTDKDRRLFACGGNTPTSE